MFPEGKGQPVTTHLQNETNLVPIKNFDNKIDRHL